MLNQQLRIVGRAAGLVLQECDAVPCLASVLPGRDAGLLPKALLAPPPDARTAYLMRSVDHADLERRQRAWDNLPP